MRKTKIPSVFRHPAISVTLRFDPGEMALLDGAMMLAAMSQRLLPKALRKNNAASLALGRRIHCAAVRSKAKIDAVLVRAKEEA